MSLFVVYLLFIVLFLFEVYFFIRMVEYFYCAFVRKQTPFVPSAKSLRRTLVKQINTHYKNAKNIVEIGSGFGGLARYIAKNTNANVVAIENMIFSVSVSKFLDLFQWHKKSRTVWCDAFKYLKITDEKFDVAIAYLGPGKTSLLKKFTDNIDVFISLDFEISDLKPVRVVDLKHGYTLYNNKKYPHKLFVYDFRKLRK
jgi:SAM-dependent methyltransferase